MTPTPAHPKSPAHPTTPASDQPPDVTVVVAVRNGASCIEECIRSLLALDYPSERVELIVVDNASTDGTRSILEGFAPRITILEESTRGAAAARNTGIRAARGRWIAFTDADCRVDPQWIAALLQPEPSAGIGIVGGQILAWSPCNRVERFGERIHNHQQAIEVFDPSYAITMNWASPAAVLHAVGLFDQSLLRGQDVDLAYRIQQAGYGLEYRSEARIEHRNERTFAGLFHEGVVHGFHNRRLRRKHERFLARGKPKLIEPSVRRSLSRNAAAVVRGEEIFESFCALTFDAGKAVGQVSGEIILRFRGTRNGHG